MDSTFSNLRRLVERCAAESTESVYLIARRSLTFSQLRLKRLVLAASSLQAIAKAMAHQ